jgi:hypothetical protein
MERTCRVQKNHPVFHCRMVGTCKGGVVYSFTHFRFMDRWPSVYLTW